MSVGSLIATSTRFLGQVADRQRTVAAHDRLGQELDRFGLDLGREDVHELEAPLLGERARQVGGRGPTVVDEDVADAPAGIVFLLERGVELLARDDAVADEKRAQLHPGES